jgi:hypothetical protein
LNSADSDDYPVWDKVSIGDIPGEDLRWEDLTVSEYLDLLESQGFPIVNQATQVAARFARLKQELGEMEKSAEINFRKLAKRFCHDPDKLLNTARGNLLMRGLSKLQNEWMNWRSINPGQNELYDRIDELFTIMKLKPEEIKMIHSSWFENGEEVLNKARKIFQDIYLDPHLSKDMLDGELLVKNILEVINTEYFMENILVEAIYNYNPNLDLKNHWDKKIQNELVLLRRYLDVLKAKADLLQKKVELFNEVGAVSKVTTKINWIGDFTVCKKLMDLLKEYGYIEIGPINKFIAEHFLFDNETTNEKTIGGWHAARDGEGNMEIYYDEKNRPYMKILLEKKSKKRKNSE